MKAIKLRIDISESLKSGAGCRRREIVEEGVAKLAKA
jgi:hypothetical protein